MKKKYFLTALLFSISSPYLLQAGITDKFRLTSSSKLPEFDRIEAQIKELGTVYTSIMNQNAGVIQSEVANIKTSLSQIKDLEDTLNGLANELQQLAVSEKKKISAIFDQKNTALTNLTQKEKEVQQQAEKDALKKKTWWDTVMTPATVTCNAIGTTLTVITDISKKVVRVKTPAQVKADLERQTKELENNIKDIDEAIKDPTLKEYTGSIPALKKDIEKIKAANAQIKTAKNDLAKYIEKSYTEKERSDYLDYHQEQLKTIQDEITTKVVELCKMTSWVQAVGLESHVSTDPSKPTIYTYKPSKALEDCKKKYTGLIK